MFPSRDRKGAVLPQGFDVLGLLDLRRAAVHEQLDARNITGVVRSKEHSSLRNFIRLTESSQRSHGRELSVQRLSLFVRVRQSRQTRSSNRTWAQSIHADFPLFQIHRPA